MMGADKIALICRAIEHHFNLPRTHVIFSIGKSKKDVLGSLDTEDKSMFIEVGKATPKGVQYHDLNEILDTVAHEYAHYTSLSHNNAFWKAYRKHVKHIRGFFERGYKPAFNCEEYKDEE